MAIGWIRVSTQRGHDHHRQPFGEVAEHLEAGAAAPQHDGGLQHDRRHAAGQQDPADLLAAAQVGRQLLALGRQPAEVHDPPDAGGRGGRGERRGRRAVGAPRTRRPNRSSAPGSTPRRRRPAPAPRLVGVGHVADGDAPRRRSTARRGAETPVRARARTDHPAASSSGTSRPPTYPLAPVTRARPRAGGDVTPQAAPRRPGSNAAVTTGRVRRRGTATTATSPAWSVPSTSTRCDVDGDDAAAGEDVVDRDEQRDAPAVGRVRRQEAGPDLLGGVAQPRRQQVAERAVVVGGVEVPGDDDRPSTVANQSSSRPSSADHSAVSAGYGDVRVDDGDEHGLPVDVHLGRHRGCGGSRRGSASVGRAGGGSTGRCRAVRPAGWPRSGAAARRARRPPCATRDSGVSSSRASTSTSRSRTSRDDAGGVAAAVVEVDGHHRDLGGRAVGPGAAEVQRDLGQDEDDGQRAGDGGARPPPGGGQEDDRGEAAERHERRRRHVPDDERRGDVELPQQRA